MEMDIQNLERLSKFYQNALTETQGRLLEAHQRLLDAQSEASKSTEKKEHIG